MGKLRTRVDRLTHGQRAGLVKVLWAKCKSEAEAMHAREPDATVVRWMERDEYAAYLASQGLPGPFQRGLDDE
jgi:hypothetical protein